MKHTRAAVGGFAVATAVVLALAPTRAREHQLPARATEAVPLPPSVSAEPQTTTASFGDWIVRCVMASAKRSCEAGQALVVQNQGRQVPIAQIAFGRADERTTPLQLTVLLPVDVSFGKPPRIGTDEAHLIPLAFRRCVPAGCFASASPDAATMTMLRTAAKPGRLIFTDAAERTLTLPLSFRGLAQALDDLDKER